MTDRPDISVVIVSFNTRDLTVQCVQSVFDTIGSTTVEVFVVDNSSSDDSANVIASQFPQARVIRNNVNVGLAAATNQGLEAGTGRYLMALNSDTVIRPGVFERLVGFMDEHPDVGAITPKLALPEGGEHPAFLGKVPSFKAELLEAIGPLDKSFADASTKARVGETIDLTESQDVPCVLWGTAFMVRREVADTVGLQDPRFFVYAEDVDWSMRISKAGWRIYYLADAEVVHYGGQSTKQASAKMLAQLRKSKCRLIQKHEGLIKGLALRLAVAFVCGVRLAKWLVTYVIRNGSRSVAKTRIDQMRRIINAVLSY